LEKDKIKILNEKWDKPAKEWKIGIFQSSAEQGKAYFSHFSLINLGELNAYLYIL
jgi:hypothetical protein